MDQTSDRPPYRQIADQVRAAIAAGAHPPGSKLPSARRLAAQYQVDRLTVTRAMELLEAEGLVIAQQGRGVFVRAAQPRQRLLRDRIAHRDERGYFFDMTARSWVAVTPPTISTGVAPDDVAALLELPPGSQVLIRDRRIGEANGPPLQLATSYLPMELARGTRLAHPDTGPGGIYDRMEEMGHVLHWTETVTARMPTPGEAAALGVPPGVPLLRILRTTLNQEHRSLEVNDTRIAADRFELGYAIQRADLRTA